MKNHGLLSVSESESLIIEHCNPVHSDFQVIIEGACIGQVWSPRRAAHGVLLESIRLGQVSLAISQTFEKRVQHVA